MTWYSALASIDPDGFFGSKIVRNTEKHDRKQNENQGEIENWLKSRENIDETAFTRDLFFTNNRGKHCQLIFAFPDDAYEKINSAEDAYTIQKTFRGPGSNHEQHPPFRYLEEIKGENSKRDWKVSQKAACKWSMGQFVLRNESNSMEQTRGQSNNDLSRLSLNSKPAVEASNEKKFGQDIRRLLKLVSRAILNPGELADIF
jgi:hypothetical protein